MSQTEIQSGVILRKRAYLGHDEILTVLMADGGVRRFFVKNARSSQKRYRGRLDAFKRLIFHYQPRSEGLWRLYDVEDTAVVPDLWADLSHFALANYFAELICEFTPEALVFTELSGFWQEFETLVAAGDVTPQRALQLLLSLLRQFGYELRLDACCRCGQSAPLPGGLFDAASGGLLCVPCAGQGVLRGIPITASGRLFPAVMAFVDGVLQKKCRSGDFLRSVL